MKNKTFFKTTPIKQKKLLYMSKDSKVLSKKQNRKEMKMENNQNIEATVNQEIIPGQETEEIKDQTVANGKEDMPEEKSTAIIRDVQQKIRELEHLAARTNEAVYETGRLLYRLHEANVCKQYKDCKTWKDFCEKKFAKSDVYVKYLMDTYLVREKLLAQGLISEKIYLSEPIARALNNKKIKDKLEEIWQEVSHGNKEWKPVREEILKVIKKLTFLPINVEDVFKNLNSENVLSVTSKLHEAKQKLDEEQMQQLIAAFSNYLHSIGDAACEEENSEEPAE